MIFLLDVNALIALAWENHESHQTVSKWLETVESFATCPIAQGGFVRISSNPKLGYANTPENAFRFIDSLLSDARHQFWPDDISFYRAGAIRNAVHSHADVTDAYLVALAEKHGGALATLDKALAKAFERKPGRVALIR